MLDRELTEENGMQEIGEIVQESHLIITSDSPLVKIYKMARLRYDDLFRQRKVYINNLGIMPHVNVPKEERNQLERELPELGTKVDDELSNIVLQTTPDTIESIDITGSSFTYPLLEAIQNAIEHGTNFCEQGNIEGHVTTGSEGILAVVSQPTPGLTSEKVQEVLNCKDSTLLFYNSFPDELRGMGLACFHQDETARVWFEFYSEDSPEFKVIILETRKRLLETGLISLIDQM